MNGARLTPYCPTCRGKLRYTNSEKRETITEFCPSCRWVNRYTYTVVARDAVAVSQQLSMDL